MEGLIVDNFAGGGGASTGIEMGCGRSPDIAINHDDTALAMHAANHPATSHRVEDIFASDPRILARGRAIDFAWFSPDCKHHSKAKGGQPREKNIRSLAWVVMRWASMPRPMKPAIIMLENVEEFQDWGPLDENNMPCPLRKGQTFNLFVHRLRQAGYVVEWRELRACDYGAPTIRKRLFMIARCDGRPIVWPDPTHGAPNSMEVAMGVLKPYRTAAECIDWTVPCTSIFDRKIWDKKRQCWRPAPPLADKTMARVARGVKRFVIDAAEPFIVNLTHGGRVESLSEPFKTITGAHRGEKALVAPFFIPRHGEHATQEPRCRSVEDPMPTVTATANGAGLVAAYMAQHNTDMIGHPMTAPVSTIVGKGCTQNLVSAFLTKFYGTSTGQDMRQPFPTVTADGQHIGEVRAFLMKYYGEGGQLASLKDPMHTLTAKARLGLVTVAGIEYQIVDIGMRMLTPRELFRAQGFPDSYVIDRRADGTPISKTDAIRMCGNSVNPDIASALIKANYNGAMPERIAA